MSDCKLLNAAIGFSKEHAEAVYNMLMENDEIIIQTENFTPKHIAMADSENLPKLYTYVLCRMETRSLMSAALAAYTGEKAEFMRLYTIR